MDILRNLIEYFDIDWFSSYQGARISVRVSEQGGDEAGHEQGAGGAHQRDRRPWQQKIKLYQHWNDKTSSTKVKIYKCYIMKK